MLRSPCKRWQWTCAEWSAPEFFSSVTAAEVRECLEAGADVNARDQAGRSPLLKAVAINSDPAVTEALLAAGADVNAQEHVQRHPLARGGRDQQ